MHTPVLTVGRLTIDRIEPHGSLGALGVGDGEAEAGAVGAGEVCPQAMLLIAATPQTKATVAPRR
ncbi:MAG: hypothetical protein WB757_10705 [Candidatus Cybelea sp.]